MDVEECVICLQPTDSGFKVITSCLHVFHYDCLMKCECDDDNADKFHCPLCRCDLFKHVIREKANVEYQKIIDILTCMYFNLEDDDEFNDDMNEEHITFLVNEKLEEVKTIIDSLFIKCTGTGKYHIVIDEDNYNIIYLRPLFDYMRDIINYPKMYEDYNHYNRIMFDRYLTLLRKYIDKFSTET